MELTILHALQTIHTPILDHIMVFFTSLGNVGVLWIILTLLALCSKKYRICGYSMALALILSLLICNLGLKNIVARDRPCWVDDSVKLLISTPKDYSFPSGHTFASFSTATALFLWYRKAGIAALITASVISFSRLYLFVHWPTDVLTSLILGVLVGLFSYYIIHKKIYSSACEKPDGK